MKITAKAQIQFPILIKNKKMITINSNNNKKFCFRYFFNNKNLCLNINKKFTISDLEFEYIKTIASQTLAFLLEYK